MIRFLHVLEAIVAGITLAFAFSGFLVVVRSWIKKSRLACSDTLEKTALLALFV